MRYHMSQRLFAIGDKGVITDDRGEIVYRNNGTFFNVNEKVALVDAGGAQVASLHSKLFKWPKTFYIEIGGVEAATVVRKFSLRMNLTITLRSGETWKLTGRWNNSEFTIVDEGGQTIAAIERDWVILTDGYSIDIADGQDDLLVLMVLVTLETAAAEDDAS